ncbi:TPA: hypothetical protein R8F93_003065 [Enterobacter soli]|uniref:Phage abortive infection protein n=1 Tax=Enterobacter soli TaxID=885040 RepID=A0AAW8H3E3_9ENTR|nr:hypothetical protein [Enterobacter soli]MDQ2255361.1 hypothetical protein [Enterobacter soli]MDQ2338217.1 hypothetical protein [Enterobacter soli]HEE9789007.1 hypothetical protein [Enterobacter soli]
MSSFDYTINNYSDVSAIATAIGALVTAVVMGFTIVAATAARKSTKLATEALEQARDNSRQDEFSRHFALLLEQHQVQQDIVKKHLDSMNNKVQEELSNIFYGYEFEDSWLMMKGHEVFSPYMRILYHLIKHISVFYEGDTASKMKYTSVVRSMIRNDVIFLVALNVSYIKCGGVYNQFEKYQRLLSEVDFFAHAIFDYDENRKMHNDSLNMEAHCYEIESNIEERMLRVMEGKGTEHFRRWNIVKNPFIVTLIIKNPEQIHARHSFDKVLENASDLYEQVKQEFLSDKFNFNSPVDFLSRFLGCYIVELTLLESSSDDYLNSLDIYSFPVVTEYYLNLSVDSALVDTAIEGKATYFLRRNGYGRYEQIPFLNFINACDIYRKKNKVYANVLNDVYKTECDEIIQEWIDFRDEIYSHSVLLTPEPLAVASPVTGAVQARRWLTRMLP